MRRFNDGGYCIKRSIIQQMHAGKTQYGRRGFGVELSVPDVDLWSNYGSPTPSVAAPRSTGRSMRNEMTSHRQTKSEWQSKAVDSDRTAFSI